MTWLLVTLMTNGCTNEFKSAVQVEERNRRSLVWNKNTIYIYNFHSLKESDKINVKEFSVPPTISATWLAVI